MNRIDIRAVLGEAFPTLDLTDPEQVHAMAKAIRSDPGKIDAALRRLMAKAQQLASGGHEPRPE